ncbi:MAG TPA: alcohol dehydrogenase catalytic domain-containing protein, partial [Blastocatellia bacterium]
MPSNYGWVGIFRMTRTGRMRACVLYEPARLDVRDVARPEPGPSDVLIRVMAVGLCGTDLHIYRGEANYNFDSQGQPVPLSQHPQILGHEITGIIESAGPDVSGLGTGDRVIIDQGLNCRSRRRAPECEYCASGDSHQCEYYAEHGITGLQGGLAEYIAVPDVNAIRIDSDIEPIEAALTEPLACVAHTMDATGRAGARYSVGAADSGRRVRSVLIIGAGPAGLLFTQYLRKVLGFDGVLLVSETSLRKRELATRFGADPVDPSSEDLGQMVIDRTAGRRCDLVIEASGSGSAYGGIAASLRKQGTLVCYGHGRAGVDLSVMNGIQFKEPVIVSTAGGSGGFDGDGRPSVYRRALRLLESGQIEVAPFISH